LNGDSAMLIGMVKYTRLPWDCILLSDVFRRYKPAPEVYLSAIELLRLKLKGVIMVALRN
jgi:2-haloacid dehalogenase